MWERRVGARGELGPFTPLTAHDPVAIASRKCSVERRWSVHVESSGVEIEGQTRSNISSWLVLPGPRYNLHEIETITEQLNISHAAISQAENLLAGISNHNNVPERTLSN